MKKAALVLAVSLLITSPTYGATLGTSASTTDPQRSGDATTGLFSPASGAVGVSSAGTEMMRVNGTGVGVGTTSPATTLQVSGTTTAQQILPATDLGYDFGSSAPKRWATVWSEWWDDNDGTNQWQMGAGVTVGNLTFKYDGVQYLTLATSGNVGIGTTTPANLLDIGNGGGIHITSGTPSSTSNALYNNSGSLAFNGALHISSGGQLQCGGANCKNSTGSQTLNYCPYKGNVKTTASQGDYAIPSACLSATITSMYVGGTGSTSVAASTLYYIYLWNTSGTWVLDAETGGHATDSSTGIEIKSSDNTKTLVGMIHTDANKKIMTGGQTDHGGDTNTVATWDNRQPRTTNCNPATSMTTSSSSVLTEVSTANRCLFMSWGDAVSFLSSLTGYSNTTGGGFDKAPSAILNQYRGQRITWFTAVWPFANTLFGLLATIEFAWSAAVMLLEKSDMQSWASALIRKLMWIGAFYALLIYGRYWIPAITDSFELIGQTASGTGPMAPSDVFTRGIDIAGALMATSSTAAFFTNLGTSLAMIFTGIITALAFIAITVQFVVAMVESYIIVAAGFIFVGFGGSRWTAPYVERYIGLGVATGVKIMLLYLLIGAGMNLSVDWMTDAQNIASNASPAMSALEIMGASIIFMMRCWQIPKLFAAVLGGSPALSGGDLVSSGAFVAGGAIAVGSMGLNALGATAGATGLLSSGAAGGAGAAGSTSAGTSSPAMLASVDANGGGSGTVPPPTSPPPTPSGGPSQPAAPLSDAARNLTGMHRRISSQVPPDAGPHATPPRLNIDHNE